MMVSLIGGFTFIAASMMAIAQNDGKKVLAFSTISNLGLIVACAGIGVEETVWGGVLLMIFHAVSKSMLFQAVGATENCLGSRDIEDMHGLLLGVQSFDLYYGYRHCRNVSGPLWYAYLKMGGSESLCGFGKCASCYFHRLWQRHHYVLLDEVALQAERTSTVPVRALKILHAKTNIYPCLSMPGQCF